MNKIFETAIYPFSPVGIESIKHEKYMDFPVIYIIYTNNPKKKIAYIGQSVRVKKRMKDHIKNIKRKDLENLLLIGHDKFNQSATYNLETNLINYFIADGSFVLQNRSQITNPVTHNYYQKSYYNEILFRELWNILKSDNLVSNSLETIQNKDVFKLSPYKELSESQLILKEKVIDICSKYSKGTEKFVYFIEGDAGTGKSVVLSSIFNTIQDMAAEKSNDLYGTNNYLLVNHSEMIKTYEKISESLPNLKKKNFLKPTSFINNIDKGKNKKADIVLVDEAHLLLSKQDNYNNFQFENQLDEIIKRSKITIVVFDKRQVLKLKSFWDESKLNKIKKNYKNTTEKLTTQFRMKADGRIIEWIDSFVNKEIKKLPEIDKDSHFGDANPFELRIFDDASEMYEKIKLKNKEFGLSRVVSTFDYVHKKNGEEYYVEEGDFKLPWNHTNYKDSWAEEKDTINEVGSIYTIQGFDLNYAGVILGPSVTYDKEINKIKIDHTKYKDSEAFRKRTDLSDKETDEVKEKIILNSINILMKRGIHGLYIYASDDDLRRKLNEMK